MTFVKSAPSSIMQTPLSQEALLRILAACPLLYDIPAAGLMLLLQRYRHCRFAAAEILNREGDEVKACPLILNGQIEVFRYSSLGDEKIFGMFTNHHIVAIAAVFMPHHRFPMNLRAKTVTEALLLEKNAILTLCHNYPLVMQRLLTRFSLKMYENINNIDWLTSSSAEQRLAACLLEFSRQQCSASFTLPFSRAQLAAQLGIRYETLSRLLSGWRRQHIISLQKNNISINRSDYLAALSISAQRAF